MRGAGNRYKPFTLSAEIGDILQVQETGEKTMEKNRAARRSCHHARAYIGSSRTRSILADREQAYLIAGLLIAVSFGLMFVYGAVMF